MGGSIALTVRLTNDRVYRGSCYTGSLPEGLWTAPFYIDLDTSRAHVETWLDEVLENRRQNPDVEALWGGWNKLAPLSYGLVIIDYVTSTLVSAQGFSSVDHLYLIRDDFDPDRTEKWQALEAAGLLRPSRRTYPKDWKSAAIALPFKSARIGDEDVCNPRLQAWCEEHFGLSDAERAAWTSWYEAYAESDGD